MLFLFIYTVFLNILNKVYFFEGPFHFRKVLPYGSSNNREAEGAGVHPMNHFSPKFDKMGIDGRDG